MKATDASPVGNKAVQGHLVLTDYLAPKASRQLKRQDTLPSCQGERGPCTCTIRLSPVLLLVGSSPALYLSTLLIPHDHFTRVGYQLLGKTQGPFDDIEHPV